MPAGLPGSHPVSHQCRQSSRRQTSRELPWPAVIAPADLAGSPPITPADVAPAVLSGCRRAGRPRWALSCQPSTPEVTQPAHQCRSSGWSGWRAAHSICIWYVFESVRDSDELHDHRHMFAQCNLTVLMCVTRRSHVTDRSYLAFYLIQFKHLLHSLQKAHLICRAEVCCAASSFQLHGANTAIFTWGDSSDCCQWPVTPWGLIVHHQDDISYSQIIRCLGPLLTTNQGRQVLPSPSTPEMVREYLRMSPPLLAKESRIFE